MATIHLKDFDELQKEGRLRVRLVLLTDSYKYVIIPWYHGIMTIIINERGDIQGIGHFLLFSDVIKTTIRSFIN